MCGRYVLALRYDEVRQELQNLGIPVYDYPVAAEEAPHQTVGGPDEAESAPAGGGPSRGPTDEEPRPVFRPSYNLAPRFHGLVLRGIPIQNNGSVDPPFAVQLQVMQWGLIPSWTKRRPDYASMPKTINCRADSLSTGGMWSSMRGHKRCVVVAQGFYEWLKVGHKERVPHYIRRHDGRPLLFAGLWDAVRFDNNPASINSGSAESTRRKQEKSYTYTIITTNSNDDMRFLHDRMPVIFDAGSPALRTWLDPARTEWSPELQSLLQPWPSKTSNGDASYLDIDVVGKDVNKVGHDSPSLVIPVSSRENRSNIANFFDSGQKGHTDSGKSTASKRPAYEAFDCDATKDTANAPAPKTRKVQTEPNCSSKSDTQMPKKIIKATAGNENIMGSANRNKGGQDITSYFRPKE